jgi:DNA-binding protein YbaB
MESARAVPMSTRAWESVLDDVDRQRAQLREVEEQLRTMTVEVTSTDRLVTVVTNARGALMDLHLEPLALRRYRADQLSSLICELTARADGELAGQRNQLTEQIVRNPGPHYRDLDEITPGEGVR